MVRVAEFTIYSNNKELHKNRAIVLTSRWKIEEREVYKIWSSISNEKITDIKWDNYAKHWTFTFGNGYNAQLELVEYPLVSLE